MCYTLTVSKFMRYDFTIQCLIQYILIWLKRVQFSIKETRLVFRIRNVMLGKIGNRRKSIDFRPFWIEGDRIVTTIESDLYSSLGMSRPRVRDYCRFSWLQYVSTNKSTRVECKVGREGRLVVLESDGDEGWERGGEMCPGNRCGWRYR